MMAPNDSNSLTELGEPDDETEVLLFETSPYGNVDAIVQQDRRTIYFYLNPRQSANSHPTASQNSDPAMLTKACWVRNLQTGPYVINEQEMRAGVPPLLPRTHTTSPQPGTLPNPENLQIVWFEEGNGAALLETSPASDEPETTRPEVPLQRQIIAVIPPWSGRDGFHGYSAQCAAESSICWPLPANPKLAQRIEQAAEFWNSLRHLPDPFVGLQQTILAYYKRMLAGRDAQPSDDSQYYSIDGGNFPPCGLIHWQSKQHHFLATVAMSFCPQPMVELDSETPQEFRRIELAVKLPITAKSTEIEAAKSGLSRLARYPWQFFRWFGPGHTCQFPGVFSETEIVKLTPDLEICSDPQADSDQMHANVSRLTFRNDPIHMLWLVPA